MAGLLLVVVFSGCASTGADRDARPTAEVWRVVENSDGHPPITFSFLEPFETYSGVFPRVEGELHFGHGGATGWFRVAIMEVTLGEADLDANVRNNMEMLAGGKFPTSTFTVRSIVGARKEYASEIPVTLFGGLELKDATAALIAPATIQDVEQDGKTLRRFRGQFMIEQLRERFRIIGPGAESDPAGNRVEVRFDVTLVRAKDSH